MILTEIIALNLWRSFRLAAIESVDLQTRTAELAHEFDQRYDDLTPESRVALAFRDPQVAKQQQMYSRLEAGYFARISRAAQLIHRCSKK